MILFNKHFRNDDYEIFFNTHTGLEIMRGINGNEDPFSLILPSLLDIGIMGHCKHKCAFCYQGHGSEANMKLADYIKIIEAVKHHTNQVALGGRGDPNQHENFKEIIEYSRKNGVVPNYTTSGIDLTDEQIEISKMCGAVAVSDYGQKYTYDAIQRFIDAGIKTNIHMMLTRITYEKCIKILYGHNPWKHYNESYIENLVDIEKLNAVIFLLFKPAGAGETLGWQPTQSQIKTFSELVFKPQSKFKIGMDSCLINHVLKYAEPTSIQRMSLDTCEGGRMSAYITPDMKLMPCSFANKSIWATTIQDDNTISNIWNKSKQFNSFRKILKEKSDCCPLNL